MKRSVLIIFAVALAGLFVWLLVSRADLSRLPHARRQVRTIVPSIGNTSADDNAPTDDTTAYDESKTLPMIVLDGDETFIQAVSADLNKDGTPDQICAVKKISEPNIFLVPAVQNPATGEYSRLAAIRTGITQTRTLLFYTSDIIGDRTNALVYSGMTSDNMQLLAVYLPVIEKDGKLSFTAVADLRTDGAITIQEVARTEAYNLGLTNGDSYPIYTYSSDPDSPQTLNQIERVYRWDRSLRRYEQVSESRIEGKKIESRLIRQLQGGDINSFEDFLSGLWYMPASSGTAGTKYLFFNNAESEVIFHNGSTEEVFTREAGAPRRYGAYLTTRNRSISSIRRLIDIELTGIDEIRIKILEDVKLKIGVASEWDGIYRKMSSSTAMAKTDTQQSVDGILKLLASKNTEWRSADGQTLRTEGNAYTLNGLSGTESGSFAVITVKNAPVIQMKPSTPGAKSHFHLAQAGNVPTGQQLTLTEVSVSIDDTQLAGSPPVVFERQ
jgi:hypothetical protein